jgi:hypothetical protein
MVGTANFRPERSYELVGSYALTMINSQGDYGDSVTTGLLDLWPNDSARQYRSQKPGPPGSTPERPLAGAFDQEYPPLSGSTDLRSSRDSKHPGAELRGRELYMGAIDGVDGWNDALTLVRVDSAGFWGTWSSSTGILYYADSVTGRRLANPAGHFCAIRRK